MAAAQSPLSLFLLFSLISITTSRSIIRFPSYHASRSGDESDDNDLYCGSWRFSVETNNAGSWPTIPSICRNYVKDYMLRKTYSSDVEVASSDSLAFAQTVQIAGDGLDAWIFDVDETLLSNLKYYELHGFGSETFNEDSFNEWVDLAEATALPASLKFYNDLKELGFTIVLLTGRTESQRDVTTKNLQEAGYTGWKKLILRGADDEGKPATLYKSEKRQELVNEGYRIHGSSGDQWSDLWGYAEAQRSFKIPNPMYYIP